MSNSMIFVLKTLCLAFLLLQSDVQGFAQTKLVLDGGIMNIQDGAAVIITNPAPDAVIRNSGHIISEGENNLLIWHTWTDTGSYVIPWGVGRDQYIPLSFGKSAGAGNGYFSFSTYSTGGQVNSSLPTPITKLEQDGSDVSASLVDRFWQIKAQDYTTVPLLSNLSFTYLQEEYTGEGSNIVEDNLQAYRWNESLDQWNDYVFNGSVDPSANTITLNSVEGEELYSWWFLADRITPLPVEMLFFRAAGNGQVVKLNWVTTSEKNSSHFTVERSPDAIAFEAVKTVAAAGFSSELMNYEVFDNNPINGINYYRLKQVDLDGITSYSKIQAVDLFSSVQNTVMVYPNPASDRVFVAFKAKNAEVKICLYDLLGTKIPVEVYESGTHLLEIRFAPSLQPSAYLLQVQDGEKLLQQKVIVK